MDDHAREPYPRWLLWGMDALAAGMLLASFRDAWAVVKGLGQETESLLNSVVAGAVVLAIDAAILILEQARSQFKMRGGNLRLCDGWVFALIALSATLNVRYLTANDGGMVDKALATALGVAIPSTIAVLGLVKGDMLAHNAKCRRAAAAAPALAPALAPAAPLGLGGFPRPLPPRPASPGPAAALPPALAGAGSADDPDEAPRFRLKRA